MIALGERVMRLRDGAYGTVTAHDSAGDGSPLVWVRLDGAGAAHLYAPGDVTGVRHRPIVERGVGAVGRVHRMLCTCGERGRDWSVRSMADRDVTLHLMDLPRVPAGSRCRDERRHDRRPWEPCEVCADQLPLFDLEVAR